METVTVEILDWGKFNPKRDQKTYTWCRLDNTLLSGQEFTRYTGSQLLVLISIVSEASKKNQSIIELDLKFLKRTARTTEKVVISTLKKLEEEKHIRVLKDEARPPHDNVGKQDKIDTTPTNERTNDTNDTNEGGECRITVDSLIELFNDIVGDQGRVKKFPGFFLPRRALENFNETSGFPQFRTKDQWEKILREEVLASDFLMGKNTETTFVVNIQWLVEQDNAFNVLSGKYSGSALALQPDSIDSMNLEEAIA